MHQKRALSKSGKIKIAVIIALSIALAVVLALIPLISAVPKDFNLNGRLTDSSGSALTGTYNVSFRIYTVESGGSSLWEANNQSVTTDSNGVFNTRLIDLNLDFSDQYYLGIEVAEDGEMSDRINLSSSPYALRAQNISIGGVEFTGNVDLGSNNLTVGTYVLQVDVNSGNVGIGTTEVQDE